MTDEDRDWTADMVREHFNPPPPTPRDEIWVRLEARLVASGRDDAAEGATEDAAAVIPLRASGSSGTRRGLAPAAWLAMAATAVLAVGIGIGRWSRAPVPGAEGVTTAAEAEAVPVDRSRLVRANRAAAVEHLARTEPLLTLVKSDVARGTVDPEVAEWAGQLLDQTRFLLDSGLPMDPEVASILEDLELILLQTTLVAGGGVEGARARQELELLDEGLSEGNVLPRMQAVIPTAQARLAGS
ncbi:MAG: hypothetical protein JSU98_01240 [Gemmatimonadales bacterium]|jgi:hypothetical protein|nr:MAG: hypothetical protein JSU98_01240 [Gemmatimonadales bacterium]